MFGQLVTCALVAAAVVVNGDLGGVLDPSNDGKPQTVDGCSFDLAAMASSGVCHFQLTLKDDTIANCSFVQLAVPFLLKEIEEVAQGDCSQGLNVETFNSEKKTLWSIGFEADQNGDRHAHGFLATLPIEELIDKLAHLLHLDTLDIGLHEVDFPVTIKDAAISLSRISGIVWFGMRGASIGCKAQVIIKSGGADVSKSGVTFGAECETGKLLDFIGRFGDVSKVSFLKDAGFGLALSTIELPASQQHAVVDWGDNGDSGIFTNMDAHQGLAVAAFIGAPKNCTDSFCKLLGNILQPGKEFMLIGSITKVSGFMLTVSLPFDFQVSPHAKLHDIELIANSMPVKVVLDVNVEIDDPDLQFHGGITGSPAGVGLEASLVGIYENAFGLGFLSFGDLIIEVDWLPPEPVPDAFQLGGTVILGYDPRKCGFDKRIRSATYFGIDSTQPTNNYFYASISDVSIPIFLNAFCLPVPPKLPKVIAETGFPNGVNASYTTNPAGQHLPTGLNIPPGLHVHGAIDILGLTSTVDIDFNEQPLAIIANVTLPVIKMGGVATFRAFPDKPEPGAYGQLKFTETNPSGDDVHFAGYLELLGFYRYAELNIDDTMFVAKTGGTVFGVFDTEMEVAASYGDIQTAAFSINGTVKETSHQFLSDAVKAKLKVRYEEGKAKFDAAVKTLQDAEANCLMDLHADCDKCMHAHETCKLGMKVCDGFCDTLLFFIKDRCKAGCAKQTDKCEHDLTVLCDDVCKIGNIIGTGLCKTVDAAIAIVNGTEKLYGSIVKLAEDGFNPPDWFNLKLFTFDVELNTEEIAVFHIELDLVIFKKEFKFDATLDLKKLATGEVEDVSMPVYELIKNAF